MARPHSWRVRHAKYLGRLADSGLSVSQLAGTANRVRARHDITACRERQATLWQTSDERRLPSVPVSAYRRILVRLTFSFKS